MPRRLEIVGAPSSAGAYAPGQERAPEAYRGAGLPVLLQERGITVTDRGDVPGFRWRIDPDHMRAMNVDAAAGVARAVADEVAAGLAHGSALLVLGGDCTVELGTVAGASRETPEVGLVYIDYDTDMNTPRSVEDGALDWMGVAHLLGLPETVPGLSGVGPRTPMLRPDQVLLFANPTTTRTAPPCAGSMKPSPTSSPAALDWPADCRRLIRRYEAQDFGPYPPGPEW